MCAEIKAVYQTVLEAAISQGPQRLAPTGRLLCLGQQRCRAKMPKLFWKQSRLPTPNVATGPQSEQPFCAKGGPVVAHMPCGCIASMTYPIAR